MKADKAGFVPDFTRGNWEWERARRLTRVADKKPSNQRRRKA